MERTKAILPGLLLYISSFLFFCFGGVCLLARTPPPQTDVSYPKKSFFHNSNLSAPLRSARTPTLSRHPCEQARRQGKGKRKEKKLNIEPRAQETPSRHPQQQQQQQRQLSPGKEKRLCRMIPALEKTHHSQQNSSKLEKKAKM